MVQDLKDFAREAGDVVYTNVNSDGTGVIEFAKESHLEFAIKNLSDRKFRTHLVLLTMLAVDLYRTSPAWSRWRRTPATRAEAARAVLRVIALGRGPPDAAGPTPRATAVAARPHVRREAMGVASLPPDAAQAPAISMC
jgi:hypothetical protein